MIDDERELEASFGARSDVDLIVGPGEPDNERFGRLLERLRKQAGLSRADAAARLGFSAEYLRLIERGKRTPALGQMRSFLAAYGADGAVEVLTAQGYRQDFLVFDPLHGDDGDPTIVEFKSRIREARRRALGSPPDEEDCQPGLGQKRPEYAWPSLDHAAELGIVVSLLTQADEDTLRKIRELLEDKVGSGAELRNRARAQG